MEQTHDTTSLPAETSPPQWARQMAALVNSQADQIRNLQNALQEREDRTNLNVPGLSIPPSSPSPTGAHTPTEETGYTGTFIRRQEYLPKPPEFDGNRADFKPWLTQMEAKLSVDLSDRSEAVRFWYTHSRLRGRALQQVTPWVTSAQKTGGLAINGLLQQLRTA